MFKVGDIVKVSNSAFADWVFLGAVGTVVKVEDKPFPVEVEFSVLNTTDFYSYDDLTKVDLSNSWIKPDDSEG